MAAPLPMEIESAEGGKEDYVAAWVASPRLYGTGSGTEGACNNLYFNCFSRHPLTTCCFNIRTITNQANEGAIDTKTKDARIGYHICSCCLNIMIGLLLFSSFAAIQLYMELDCGSGCEPWVWPNATAAIQADPRFNAAYWPAGTEMCSPILGESIAGPGEGTQNFTLGPSYPKPFPAQNCGEECDISDPLHTPAVLVNVIWGVIFNVEGDHHCYDDIPESLDRIGITTCYYMQRSIYEYNVCGFDRYDNFGREWWGIFIACELIQIFVQGIMNSCVRRVNEGAWVLCAGPMFIWMFLANLMIVVAALFSSIFRRYLVTPYFAGLFMEWLIGLGLPILFMPLFCLHRSRFQRMFPGAANIHHFRKDPNLIPAAPVAEIASAGCFELVGDAFLVTYETGAKMVT